MNQGDRSEIIAYEGLRHAPENELGVVLLFGKIHRKLGFPELDIIQPFFPDCWASRKTRSGTRRVWIEFEYRSRSFQSHLKEVRRLRPRRGVIVCWEHNWAKAEQYADVMELRSAIGLGKRVWIQCINPKDQLGLDETPARNKHDSAWTVSQRARPGDIVLMYRSGTKADARRYGADESLLQSIANVYEFTGFTGAGSKFGRGRKGDMRQLALLPEPVRLQHLRDDLFLRNAFWVRRDLQGQSDVTGHWWRLKQLILQLNPELRKNRALLAASELSLRAAEMIGGP